MRESFTGTPELAHRPDLRLLPLDHHLALAHELGAERLVEVEDRLDHRVVLVVERLHSARVRERKISAISAAGLGPVRSNCFETRSSRPTPAQKRAQNWGSSAPIVTWPSAASYGR